jgi:hypothetical protein
MMPSNISTIPSNAFEVGKMCRYQAESLLQPHIKQLEKTGIADILVSGRFGMTFLY